MIYSQEVEMMCPVAQGANHGPAPIPEEAKLVKAKEIKAEWSNEIAYIEEANKKYLGSAWRGGSNYHSGRELFCLQDRKRNRGGRHYPIPSVPRNRIAL